MKQWVKERKMPLLSLVLVGMAISALAIVMGQPEPTAAAPYLGCSPNGYIFKYGPPTQVQGIDMVTGAGSAAGSIPGRQFNAVGYNPKDNNFYGWDLQAGVPIKVSSDFATVTPLTFTGYSGPTANLFSGDVDEDGYYWFFTVSGGTTTWYRVNLNTSPNPTFVESGSTANPTGSEGTDWAFVPGTDNLYRGMDNGTNITIVAFNRTSKTYSTVGVVSNITASADRNMGAVYADPKGNFYMSSHGSGKLWRVDLGDTPPFTAVELDAADPNSNDGARCALASVPTDFGDAPSSFDTLIADDGPRHNVGSFNVFDSTAPLMLGKKIDIENDGLPNADASGDDDDHEGISGGGFVDDERGVTHIVATPGSSVPLNVPAYVTNASSQAAMLVGWIDLDNDGTFETGERVSAGVAAGFSGYKNLIFPAPPAPYSVNTYARFRIFSATDSSPAATSQLPTGPATGGEVEDVFVQVGTYDVSKTANPAEGSTVDPGQTVTYTLTIRNTGPTALNNLKIDDNLSDVLDDATVQGTPTVSPSSAGSANVSGNTLEFAGDVGMGGTVTITYAVKVKDGGSLGNAALNNFVLAAHSTSCHPQISDSNATVNDPDCKTNHRVNALADTGSNILLPLLVAGSLIGSAGAALYLTRKRLSLSN